MVGSDSDSDTGAGRNSKKVAVKKVGSTKFTQNTSAYRKLKKLFEEKHILATDKPAEVRLRMPEFQDYTTQQFRSQFNKLKSIFGTCSKEGMRKQKQDEDDEDDLVQQEDTGTTLAPFVSGGADTTFADTEDDSLLWVPKKLVTEWKNKDGVRCLTLIFQLTGGAAASNSGGVEVKVSNSGDEFAISEVWSSYMEAIDDFYKLFPKPEDETEDEFKRRQFAMEDKIQSMVTDHGALRSVYRMTLPFRVDPTVRRVRILGTTDGCRFAHIDLAEKKKIEVEQVYMMDKRKLPASAEKKREYSGL